MTSPSNIIDFTPAKPTPSYVAVTPELATRWLAGNRVNRPLRVSKIEQYARDMTAGRWNFSESAICFSPDGRLLNGQHRLHAVIKCGRSIVMLIIRNMPPESMQSMDSGVARTAADALGFANEKYASHLAAAARQCLLYTDGRIYRDNKAQATSHGEIQDFINAHPGVRTSVVECNRFLKRIDTSPTAITVAHWIISLTNPVPLATHYVEQLASLANEPDGSPILAVDSRLRELRRNRTTLPIRDLVYLLVKGWNAYATGKTVRSLSVKPKTGHPLRIPHAATWSRT